MTGRTHDLGAFAALSYVVASQPPEQITLSTALVALSANFIGGLAPDIDQPTGDLWHRFPAGGIFGKLLYPLLGGHRFISHSIFGIFLFGAGVKFLLDSMSSVLLVNMNFVWWAFMIGFVSHLVMDTLTREGVPWLFPIGVKIGLPPFKGLRMKTGGIVEKFIVFPGLLFLTGYIYWSNYGKFLMILKRFVH